MSDHSTDRSTVAIVEDVWGPPFDQLRCEVDIRWNPHAWKDRQALLAATERARALVVRNRTHVDRSLLAARPHLEVIGRAGVGLDNIDLKAAAEHGIVVVAPLGANAISVAEHSLALVLALARQLTALDAGCRAGAWTRVPGRELAGRTWGMLGAGATARACARVARALGMQVIAYDPYADPARPELVELGVRLLPLTEVAASADVLSCHLPVTQETYGVVDADVLDGMKPSALFVNVGRGETVEEEALANALETGTIAGAGLDVRTVEPPQAGRLEQLPNVVLTPHIAGITVESQERIVRILADDLSAVLVGRPATHAVAPVPQRWDS